MIVDSLFQSIEKGREGLNKGLSTGLPKFDSVTYGVQRKWLNVIAGDSGSVNNTYKYISNIYLDRKYDRYLYYCRLYE